MIRFFHVAAGTAVLTLAPVAIANAQTWHWDVTTHVDGRSVNGRSSVDLTGRELTITYVVSAGGRELPVASCRANVDDVARVQTANSSGSPYVFVFLKHGRTAACGSGAQTIAMAPIGADAAAGAMEAALAHACCGAPAPRTVAAAVPTPSPSPTAAPAPRPEDGVERQGVFAFLRVHNAGSAPLTIAAGEIVDCRSVTAGCGRFIERPVDVGPGESVTLATIVSGSAADATFSYRYEVQSGSTRFTLTGRSTKSGTDPRLAMSAAEMRAAEAVAIGGLHAAPVTGASAPPAFVPARLVERGSTQLGVGEKGDAVVRVRLDENGTPQNATIVSVSNRAIVPAALELAVSSRYEPAKRNGRPVAGDYVATFQLSGEDPATASIPVWRRDLTASPSPSPAPTESAR